MYITILPCILLGMFLQHKVESVTLSEVSKADIDAAASRFQSAGSISRDQKVFGAVLDKREATSIIESASDQVYIRVGLVNNKMTLYLGNDQGAYMKPAADGYCPAMCPFD